MKLPSIGPLYHFWLDDLLLLPEVCKSFASHDRHKVQLSGRVPGQGHYRHPARAVLPLVLAPPEFPGIHPGRLRALTLPTRPGCRTIPGPTRRPTAISAEGNHIEHAAWDLTSSSIGP